MTAVSEALVALGIEDFLLGIPDRSFPGSSGGDTGAGAPDSDDGRRFLAWVRAIGFTGIQLGPQGDTPSGNASPYDGTMFSRGRLTLAPARLATPEWSTLLAPAFVDRLVADCPAGDADRVRYRYALGAHERALAAAYAAFVRRREDPDVAPLAARLSAFAGTAGAWLARDALYQALCDAHDGAGWRAWSDPAVRQLWNPADDATVRALAARHAAASDRWTFTQFVLHEQHRSMRAVARALGLTLWADLQVGFSDRDVWAWQALFLEHYRLGAPPSRTNPDGQTWNYPVFDPAQPAASAAFVAARMAKCFAEYDGVRIDHPHGFVCPWVYRTDTGDDGVAVRSGARLLDSPELPDHPDLAPFAIARRSQLNPDPRTPRHADDWVATLEPDQVARYARLVDVMVDAARRHGRDERALACEVLSTCPYPLQCVLERHGLGRFRVTHKANLDDPRDGYRSENAAPEDWIMAGTHDTPSVWTRADEWRRTDGVGARADYLAARLAPHASERTALATRMREDPALLVHAQMADLFASPARHVLVFFTDAFGLRAPYNRPGVVDESNWTLRLPADHVARYAARLATDTAWNLPWSLALALRAAGASGGDRAALAARLDAEAVAWRGGALPW